MTIFDKIKAFLRGENNKSETPEAYCPNCWGRQEYEGKVFEAVHNEKITLNNLDQKVGWIEAYAERNLTGIRLKEDGNTKLCPSCNLVYKHD